MFEGERYQNRYRRFTGYFTRPTPTKQPTPPAHLALAMSGRERVDVKFVKSTEANVGNEKANWIDWTRIELFYYLVGEGFEVNYERVASPGPSYVDIVGTLDSWSYNRDHPDIFFIQFNGEQRSSNIDRRAKDTARGWLDCDPANVAKVAAWMASSSRWNPDADEDED